MKNVKGWEDNDVVVGEVREIEVFTWLRSLGLVRSIYGTLLLTGERKSFIGTKKRAMDNMLVRLEDQDVTVDAEDDKVTEQNQKVNVKQTMNI